MTPETQIITAISNTWVEKFPEGDTTAYPKGLVQRISTPMVLEKDLSAARQFNSRIRFIWYDKNTIAFDAKMNSILDSVYGLVSDANIKNVEYQNRIDRYNKETDIHSMEMDFIIKHFT